MNDIGTILTLVGMAVMVGSLYEHRPMMPDDFCDIAARLRHLYRLPRHAPRAQRDALNELHTIQ